MEPRRNRPGWEAFSEAGDDRRSIDSEWTGARSLASPAAPTGARRGGRLRLMGGPGTAMKQALNECTSLLSASSTLSSTIWPLVADLAESGSTSTWPSKAISGRCGSTSWPDSWESLARPGRPGRKRAEARVARRGPSSLTLWPRHLSAATQRLGRARASSVPGVSAEQLRSQVD